jgi:cytochrome c-type biogenesis protein
VFIASVGVGMGLDQTVLHSLAAILLVAFGIVLLFPHLQMKFATATSGLSGTGQSLLAKASLDGLSGQFVLGLLLGVVWSPCVGPTLGATVTLASQGQNLAEVALMMFIFGIGASIPLTALGMVSRETMAKIRGKLMSSGKIGKQALGGIMLMFGVMILSGTNKIFESWVVQDTPDWLTRFTTLI